MEASHSSTVGMKEGSLIGQVTYSLVSPFLYTDPSLKGFSSRASSSDPPLVAL